MFFCVIVFERTISKDFNKAMSRFTRARLSSRRKLIHFCYIFPHSTALEKWQTCDRFPAACRNFAYHTYISTLVVTYFYNFQSRKP